MADTPWQSVAALVDPVRRALYEYVRRQDHPVTREEAAAAQAISRNLTAFHLDKLVEARLLVARYEAPANQPRGRGRTPKVYEPSGEGLSLTVPTRQYELIGQILADAVAEEPDHAGAAVLRHAFAHGRQVGRHCANAEQADLDGAHVGSAHVHGADLDSAMVALADLGFEPRLEAETVTLGNCPFHALAVRQPELVCGMNRAFVAGLLAGLGTTSLEALLQPHRATCCVVVSSGGDEHRPETPSGPEAGTEVVSPSDPGASRSQGWPGVSPG